MSIQPGVGYIFADSSSGTALTIQQPWSPWINNIYEDTCSPFKVKNITEGSGFVSYEICPGTINNLMPQVFNVTAETFQNLDALSAGSKLILNFDSTTSSNVFLRVGQNPTTYVFPDDSPDPSDPDDYYPRIYSTGLTIPADSDNYAYLRIAKVVQLGGGAYRVDQYVTGSLWADRIKLGSLTARYYYARI